MQIKLNPFYNPVTTELSKKYQGLHINSKDITKSLVVYGWSKESVLKKLLLYHFSPIKN